jgi:hypothetical protein
VTLTAAERAEKYSHAEPAQPLPLGSAEPTRRYDLVKEFVVAFVVVALLTVVLAVVFSSPDDKSVSLAGWATAAPNDFVATATAELAGTSGSAAYGAPYNRAGPGQKLGPLALQRWAGVTVPVDSANDFVVSPLRAIASAPDLTAALSSYDAASADQRTAWAAAYSDALSKAPDGDPAQVTAGDFGPIPVMTGHLATLARSGGLDGALLAQGGFYKTDYTKPLLFLADGTYLSGLARAQHLGGNQWGIMNETGRYPGQAWLWLYTFWYQVKPFNHSGNADALVWALMALLTLVFIGVPFIPGLRSIPKWIPIHRVIWRTHYRQTQTD